MFNSQVKRLGAVMASCLTAITLAAQTWTAGSSPVIASGESVTISSAQPNIVRFTDNGTLTFAAGGSVTITGSLVTAVGSGNTATGVLTMTGGSITNQGSGYFVVGYLGGRGSMTLANGAVWRSTNGRLRIAGNEEGQRDKPSYGEALVSGTLSSDVIEFTGYFPTNLTPPYVEFAKLTLNAGGVVEAGQLQKNDCALSTLRFNGGTLRAKQTATDFITGRGVMDLVIADNTNAVFDTNGKNVTIVPYAAPYDTVLTLRGETNAMASGNGGLVKTGAGALVLRLPAACNTFTGAVTVLQGTLDLGRPLADNQPVTVFAGGNFVVRSTNDLDNITYNDGGTGTRMTYTVALDTGALDLSALSAMYYDERLAGPLSGTVTLSNTLTHSAGTVGSPFRLIGQGGTLNLTNTTLETEAIQVEGTGTFNFLGSRTYTSGDAGKLSLTDGCYRQDQTFSVADAGASTPASLAFATGRFQVGNWLDVGVNGYGTFTAAGTALTAGGLRIGGGTGFAGAFTQSTGTVTLGNESYVGLNGGTGSLMVAGGQLIVNNNLRIASNPSVNTSLRPQGSVTVSNGLLQCSGFWITSWWPVDGSAKTVEAGLLTLLSGGVAEVNSIYKNDDPISTVVFNGGLLRARAASSSFLFAGQTNGTLRVQVAAGQYAAIDTQGYGVTIAKPVGTLTISGAGGLKKLGTGTLTFSANQVAYAGDTVVEAGVLRLGDHDQIPHGSGTGHVQLASGTVLDLNGKNEAVNRLIGLGRVISTNAPATLGVLADGSDDTWSRSCLSGAITLDKRGAGTLTLATAQAVPTNLIVSGGTVKLAQSQGYPFYRFKIEGVKTPATANAMQVSEIALFNDGVNVTTSRVGIAYDSTGGIGGDAESNAFPSGEMPEKAVDGIVNVGTTTGNKWLDFRAKLSRTAADKARVWLRIDYPASQKITHYNWATGNDSENRDPAVWRLQGSYDGAAWTDVDFKTNYVATATRNAWVTAGGFPVSSVHSANILSDSAWVTVRPGATLDLGGLPETVGGLVGSGQVVISNTALTISAVAGATNTFAGTLSGDGSLVKAGAGTQVLGGTNLLTGDLTVGEGCLAVNDGLPQTWFRFTIRANSGATNVTQISELALYGADGTRCNTNLTLGTGVGSLLANQFACPENYPLGNSTESPDKLFDGNTGTKWCLVNNIPVVENPATYRIIVMRLAAGAPEITSYNLCTANDVPERDPSNWTLESSADGVTWKVVDTRAAISPPAARYTWYNGGAAYGLSDRALYDADRNLIPDSSAVEVRQGATLDFLYGADAIGALRVDMLSAGTLAAFSAAPGGSLYILNASGSTAGLVLPLTIGRIEGRSNLSAWSVYVNGEVQSGVTLSVSPDGRLVLLAKGALITVR